MSFTILLLVVLLCGLIAMAMQRGKSAKEHFEEDATTADEPAPADSTSAYSNRLYVIKVFDTMFNRNPTHNELEAYSSGSSGEKDILDKIVKDYDKLTNDETTADVVDGFFADFADAAKSVSLDADNVKKEIKKETLQMQPPPPL